MAERKLKKHIAGDVVGRSTVAGCHASRNNGRGNGSDEEPDPLTTRKRSEVTCLNCLRILERR